jgi:hypothetical protein
MQGRHLPDVPWGSLPSDLQPGDYWKCTGFDLGEMYSTNLTRTIWQFFSPDGNGIGTLMSHTVREEDDGTISVRPGDGSSNSILHKGSRDVTWHGYIDHGFWIPV